MKYIGFSSVIQKEKIGKNAKIIFEVFIHTHTHTHEFGLNLLTFSSLIKVLTFWKYTQTVETHFVFF